jgi:type 1 glutamine amidotransferase
MSTTTSGRVHVITGGYPPGALSGHDMDYTRLKLLGLLAEQGLVATLGNDFSDIHRWLPGAQLLITYVAGPYLDDDQNRIVRQWLDDGGHWLGLHGTSGGKATRVGEGKRRRMVKTSHHDTLGGFFLSHPPIRKFRVDVVDPSHPLTRDMPESFETVDEPYMVEIQHPSETQLLLTAELGPDNSPPGTGFEYDEDTALQPDGKTRVLGFIRNIGKGGVTYIALGHCSPPSRSQPTVDSNPGRAAASPAMLATSWESDAYIQLLRNAIAWGVN